MELGDQEDLLMLCDVAGGVGRGGRRAVCGPVGVHISAAALCGGPRQRILQSRPMDIAASLCQRWHHWCLPHTCLPCIDFP